MDIHQYLLIKWFLEEEIKFNNDNKFDFSVDPKLIHGNLMENGLAQMLTNKGINWEFIETIDFEVKSESKCVWGKYEALYFEYAQESNGVWVDSGLLATKAHMWCIILKDWYNNTSPCGFMMFTTEYIKERIQKLLKLGLVQENSKPKTKDGSATKAWIVPIRYLYIHDGELQEHYDKELSEARERIKNKKKFDT